MAPVPYTTVLAVESRPGKKRGEKDPLLLPYFYTPSFLRSELLYGGEKGGEWGRRKVEYERLNFRDTLAVEGRKRGRRRRRGLEELFFPESPSSLFSLVFPHPARCCSLREKTKERKGGKTRRRLVSKRNSHRPAPPSLPLSPPYHYFAFFFRLPVYRGGEDASSPPLAFPLSHIE